MKKGILPLVLAMSSISATTYYIKVDKAFKPSNLITIQNLIGKMD